MNENDLSREIIGAAIEVHRELGGPGLLESIYEEALCAELHLRGISCQRQIDLPVFYKGQRLNKLFRLDLLVGELVIVEVKAVDQAIPIHLAQCLTQLRITGKKLGMVVNFGQKLVKDGIHRVVNGLSDS